MCFKKIIFLFLILVSFKIFSQQPKLMLPIGHKETVNSAKFSPDGKRIVTASNDGTAKIWDAVSGNLLADLIEHIGYMNSAEFSRDGKKIVTVSLYGTVKIWDAETGTYLIDVKGKGINAAQFSPDSKKILTASSDHTAAIWDVITGNILFSLKGHNNDIRVAKFSPDGKKIVTVSDSTIKIWNADNGTNLINLIGHSGNVRSAQFSRDGKKIVTVSSADKSFKIWDAVTGILLIDIKEQMVRVLEAQFSPDGKKILTYYWMDKNIKIWDADKGILLIGFDSKSDRLNAVQFSPDGSKIVTAPDDNYNSRIFDASSGSLLAVFNGHTNSLKSAQFSRDGKKVVTASFDNTAKIWDAFSGKLLADLKGQTYSFHFADFCPDGKKIVTASSDKTVKIWDAFSGNILTDIKGPTSYVFSAQISPDGKKVITTSTLESPKIWDALKGTFLFDLKGHSNTVRFAAFSPDGNKIITTSDDYTAKIWDASTGILLIDINKHTYLTSAQFSPDGKKIVTWSERPHYSNYSNDSNDSNNTAKIWDVSTGNLITDLNAPPINYAQFSADGGKVVTVSWNEKNSVKIWDAASGNILRDLKESTFNAVSAQFSPDGKKIITVFADKTAKIWDALTGNLLVALKGNRANIYHAKFSPDGKQVFTTFGYGNSPQIWDAVSGTLLVDLDKQNHANFSPDGKKIITIDGNGTSKIWNSETGKIYYTFLPVDSNSYLVIDSSNRYDGSEVARNLLYFTCGTEIIELDQVKDQLWVPNLAERIMKGETINAKTLDELNLCGLTPEVEDASSKVDEYYFKINPRRGGLGETVLYVNGIEARRYKPRELKKSQTGYELIIKKNELKNFFITGKENPVIVKAYTADNAISSRGVILNEDLTNVETTPPNLYAVMVGISDYKGDELDLKYAAKDATDISAALANAARKLLNTDSKEHVFIYDLTTAKERYQLPEKNSIKKGLEEIGKKATANDILFIFFAGHGVMSARSGTDREGDKKQFYFLTADASKASAVDAINDVGISTNELTEWMSPQNIKAQKRIMIFDACNSGQAIKDFVKMGTDNQNYIAARSDDNAQQIKAIDKLNEKSGLFILSASASNQNAYEMGRYSQGLLTYSLLKAIKQQPDILNAGKYLDVSRWFNAAKETVVDLSKESGARQEPQIVSNTNFNIGLVDDEVMAKIVLPQEKPMFTGSNLQNSDENIAMDDLEINKLLDARLSDIAARGIDGLIIFTAGIRSNDAYALAGRYEVKGKSILARIIIRQGKEIKYRFEQAGTTDSLRELAAAIAEKAMNLIK